MQDIEWGVEVIFFNRSFTARLYMENHVVDMSPHLHKTCLAYLDLML